MQWFEVDKEGLAKLLERRGKAFAITELIQNAWDTDATTVQVLLDPVPGVPFVNVEVRDDDENGFANLSHAFTLFAESVKKGDAEKRGRFNLGEKLVLALCTHASVMSTTGTVRFDDGGRHHSGSLTTDRGSVFNGKMRMTRSEYDEALAVIRSLLPPLFLHTYVNGEKIERREPVARFETTLPTEIADATGVLRRSERKCIVEIYEPRNGEIASVYEMGIPVVETGDRWHVNVLQKVPLNFDRDNLPPSYLRKLRVLVLNEMHNRLTDKDANATWVRDAGSDKNAAPEAVTKIMDLRFGEKRAIVDPSDPEANALAMMKGYTLIHGGMLNGGEWANVKAAGAALPTSTVTPSPKPFSPDGEPLKMLAAESYTPHMARFARFANDLARELLGVPNLGFHLANDFGWPFAGTYGAGILTVNVARLGYDWFILSTESQRVASFLIHEFAHHYEINHLSEKYHDALCDIGARMARLALEKPELWRR